MILPWGRRLEIAKRSNRRPHEGVTKPWLSYLVRVMGSLTLKASELVALHTRSLNSLMRGRDDDVRYFRRSSIANNIMRKRCGFGAAAA